MLYEHLSQIKIFDWEFLVVVLIYTKYDWISLQAELLYISQWIQVVICEIADKKGCK